MASLNSLTFKNLCTLFQRRSHDRWFESAISDCADGLWDYNLTTGTLYISPKLRTLTGYSEEDTANAPLQWWIGKVHPKDQAEISKRVQELNDFKSEFIFFEAFRFLCRNNEYIWLENHAKILRDKNSRLTRIAGITFNITPLKIIQHQLRTVIAEQNKGADNKLRFLSALNHDLRSPLSGVIGMVSLLKETPLSAGQHRFVDNISSSAEMLLTLVNDILDVSKLTSGKFEFEKICFSPTQTLKQASEMIRSPLIKKNLAFKGFVEEGIPDHVMGDPTRLQQVLVNLLGNAAKFTSEGGITLVLKEAPGQKPADRQTRTLRFEVSDTGIGIAPEIQGRLFEDFIQGDTSISRVYGGTGLGLSICKELVHLMGGQIGLVSELGKGSTFWFEIPFEVAQVVSEPPLLNIPPVILDNVLQPEPVPSVQGQETTPLPAVSAPALPKLNVLLAEDNRVNQEVMIGLLAHLGDDVTLASNGQEAVDLFPTQKFDIVLMDLNMPVLDGLSATQMIRQLPNGDIPVIAVTANTFTGDRDTCLYHGITGVLNKPISKASLQEALIPYRLAAPALEEGKDREQMADLLPPDHIDKGVLKMLVNDLGQEKVASLLKIYRDEGLRLVSQIRQGTSHNLKDPAHTLAGMSENLGFVKIGKAARCLMDSSPGDAQQMENLVRELENHFQACLKEMDALDIYQTSAISF